MMNHNDADVKLGLEIAARVLEMRLKTIHDTPASGTRMSEMCKKRAINEMAQAIEHVRNFIAQDALRLDGIATVTSDVRP